LPAPAGGAVTTAVALVLTLTPGASPGLAGTGSSPGWRPGLVVLRTAVLTAAPFWLFLLLLHDVPSTIAIGLRLTTMIASVVWVGALLPPGRLVEAMVAAGWGVTAAYLFAAALSAVPLLKARAQRIVDAQRCRGLSPRGGLGRRLRALRALALPLVLSVLHEVDERALALETRGFVPGARRTPLAPRGVGGKIEGRVNFRGRGKGEGGRGIVLPTPWTQLSGMAFTVWDEVAFGPANLGWPRERIAGAVDRSLAALDIGALAARDP